MKTAARKPDPAEPTGPPGNGNAAPIGHQDGGNISKEKNRAGSSKKYEATDPKSTGNAPSQPEAHPIVRVRPGQLRRLFWRRHGKTFPRDEIGRRDASIMLDHLVQGVDAYQEAKDFLDQRCPWMPPAERLAAIGSAFQRRKFWTPSALGDALGLTWEERDDCSITTFRPAGASDADMAERRKMKEAARQRERRRQVTLHPKPDLPLPAIRAEVIASILRPGERCTIAAMCKELKRRKHIRFIHLKGKVLAAAVHTAIDHGTAKGFLRKDV